MNLCESVWNNSVSVNATLTFIKRFCFVSSFYFSQVASSLSLHPVVLRHIALKKKNQ